MEDPTAKPTSWGFERVEWAAVNPGTLGIYRVSGMAQTQDGSQPFSMVFKAVGDVDLTGHPLDEGYIHLPEDWNYWKREALVFQSGVLDGYRGPLVAVRCLGVEDNGDSAFMWLEELHDDGGRQVWPIDRLVLAAQHLGRFSGDHLGAPPSVDDYPWLCQNFTHDWVAMSLLIGAKEACESDEVWRHPLLRNAFPRSPRQRVASLLADVEALLETAHSLPATLTHHDAHWDNLFRRSDGEVEQTVVVDWGFLGLAAVGEDLGHQVGVNVFHLRVPAGDASSYEEGASRSFLEGVSKAGVQVDRQRVRLVSQAVAALRMVSFAAAHVAWLSDEDEAPWPDEWATARHLDVDQLLHRWAAALWWLLDLGDQARHTADLL